MPRLHLKITSTGLHTGGLTAALPSLEMPAAFKFGGVTPAVCRYGFGDYQRARDHICRFYLKVSTYDVTTRPMRLVADRVKSFRIFTSDSKSDGRRRERPMTHPYDVPSPAVTYD